METVSAREAGPQQLQPWEAIGKRRGGEALVDEATTTFDNGFGFWLPDDATGLIEVSYQGRTGTTEFSTTDDGATCVTDLRLT